MIGKQIRGGIDLQKPKLGIAFSGGGARLLSGMGAVQAFEEFGLRPDAVSGCSKEAQQL